MVNIRNPRTLMSSDRRGTMNTRLRSFNGSTGIASGIYDLKNNANGRDDTKDGYCI
jgi:hypothetical protein